MLTPAASATRYDAIGHGYARTRREDPGIRAHILRSLGSARSVVNVGAGSGSYEPRDRAVIAIEPSRVMAAQRPPELSPAICAEAQRLPLHDQSVDAAMAIFSVHHWDGHREQGVRELRRVARGPVVILTCDPEVSAKMWLLADYLPELAALDRQTLPSLAQLASWLGGSTEVQTLPVSRTTCDWMLLSFWAHPERVLDASARSATSGIARMPAAVVDRLLATLGRDLLDGTWNARHGHLRELAEYDAGLRLLVNTPE